MGFDLTNISFNMTLLRNLGLLIIGIYILSLFFRQNSFDMPLREGLSEKKEEDIAKKLDLKIKKTDSDINGLEKITDLDNFEEDITKLLENTKKVITYEAFNDMCKKGRADKVVNAGMSLMCIDRFIKEMNEL